MRKILFISIYLLASAAICFAAEYNFQTYNFNWAKPTSLDPSFPEPSSSHRQGSAVGFEEFISGPVALIIDDDNVDEINEKAYFFYNIYTEGVELRVFQKSIITVTASSDHTLSRIEWTNTNYDSNDDLMEYLPDEKAGAQGSFKNNVWKANDDALGSVTEVKFRVVKYIYTTNTAVETAKKINDSNSVINITTGTTPTETWFSLQGHRLPTRPTNPGLYLCRKGQTTSKVSIK